MGLLAGLVYRTEKIVYIEVNYDDLYTYLFVSKYSSKNHYLVCQNNYCAVYFKLLTLKKKRIIELKFC